MGIDPAKLEAAKRTVGVNERGGVDANWARHQVNPWQYNQWYRDANGTYVLDPLAGGATAPATPDLPLPPPLAMLTFSVDFEVRK